MGFVDLSIRHALTPIEYIISRKIQQPGAGGGGGFRDPLRPFRIYRHRVSGLTFRAIYIGIGCGMDDDSRLGSRNALLNPRDRHIKVGHIHQRQLFIPQHMPKLMTQLSAGARNQDAHGVPLFNRCRYICS